MQRVYVADSPAKAHLVVGALEEAGIRCVVLGEMLFGARGDFGLNPASLPAVCVGDADVAQAAEIIAVHEGKLVEDAREEDEDAAPRPPLFAGAARIVALW